MFHVFIINFSKNTIPTGPSPILDVEDYENHLIFVICPHPRNPIPKILSQQGSKHIETSIIRLLQEQNPLAITFIFQNYQQVLFGIILKIVRQHELAEDVLQESLVKMWKYGNTYDRRKGRLFTWMLNICRNTAIDKIRLKANSQNIRNEDSPVNVNIPEPSERLNTDLIGLRDMLTRLDQNHREVIEYVYLKEYTHKEAAEALGIPLGTLKTRVRNAIKQLQNLV